MPQRAEAAAALCLSRTNYDVEIEHLLLKLPEDSDTDFTPSCVTTKLTLARLVRPDARSRQVEDRQRAHARPDPRLLRLFEEAWLLASIDYGAARIGSGHLLLALLGTDDLARLAREISKEFNASRSSRCAKICPDLPPRRARAKAAGRLRLRSARAAATRVRDAARRQDARARPVHHRPHGASARRARSTRCLGATSRFARSSTS